MLVHRPRLKTQGALATMVATLALGACTDPAARTDLRPEGPPDVLAVLVLNDAAGGLIESAAYCKSGDEKRPGLVGLPDFTTQQICPDDLSADPSPLVNAAPELWYVRIMFDELLDASVEDLIPVLDENDQDTGVATGTLRNTQPVTLQCAVGASNALVDVEYDGFYSPSGNSVTWPLGPSLVIKPVDPTRIPVESQCQVTLKNTIKDKAGNAPDKLGPFTFRLAPVEVLSISPSPDETVNPEFGGVDLTFNVEVDSSTLDGTMFSFTPAMTNEGVDQYSGSGVFIYGDMADSQDYAFEIAEGTKIKDKCGKESTLVGDNLATNFSTAPLGLVNIIPFQGPNAVPSRKIRINFNQIMNPASLALGTDYEWVGAAPELPGTTAPFVRDGADPSIIIVNGFYKIGTNYQFKLKAGAQVASCPGGNCSLTSNALTIDKEQLINITTATAITNTSISIGAGSTGPRGASVRTITGSGGQTLHKNAVDENVFVRFAFNQDMDGTSLANTEVEITKADGTSTGIALPATAAGGASVTQFNVGALPVGAYKFKIKQGATINDRLSTPTTFTQAADREFTFQVVVDSPGQPFSCLGAS